MNVASTTISLRQGTQLAVRLLKLLAPNLTFVAKGLLLQAGVQLVALVVPLLSRELYDSAYPAQDYSLMRVVVLGVAIVSITGSIMTALRSYYNQVVSARLNYSVGLQFFDRILRLRTDFLDLRLTGEVLSRTQDLQRATGLVVGILQNIIVNGTMLAIAPVLLILINWRLAILSLASIPVTTFISLVLGKPGRKLAKKAAEQVALHSAFSFEMISNHRTIRSLSAEDQVLDRAAEFATRANRAQLEQAGLLGLTTSISTIVTTLGSSVMSWYAWTLILDGQLSIGGFVAFSAYVGYLTGPVTQLAGIIDSMQQGSVALGRFFEYFDAPAELPRSNHPAVGSRQQSSSGVAIRFEDVSFGYTPSSLVFGEASFSIKEGEVVAFVGPSGAGKSSIARLIVGLYPPSRGRIFIDGELSTASTVVELRRRMGVVWQENSLFSGTIRENLMLGQPEAKDACLLEQLRIAQLDQYVRSLDNGLDSPVAEAGSSLSSGQRQRLCIARALGKHRNLLVLDEATANLDAGTEADLLSTLIHAQVGKTIVLITHRASVASIASRVYFVNRGNVTGGEPHGSLMQSNPQYARHWGEDR